MRNHIMAGVVGALAVLGLSQVLAVRSAGATAPPSMVQASLGGRYQIVNGTPEMTRNIMLLDTQLGATWVLCGDPSETSTGSLPSTWCAMRRETQH